MSTFGKARLDDFLLNDEYTFINHGSYGAVAKPVNLARQKMLADFEGVPDMFFRRKNFGFYEENIVAAAKFLGSAPENLVFATNTTAGINTVLKNIRLEPGDKILLHSWTYMAVRRTVELVCERTGAVITDVNIRLPIKSTQDLVENYRNVITSTAGIKLAVIDMISSVPPTTMPYNQLMTLCKEHGILTLLDGAHTPGQIPVDLEALGAAGADFYVANLHKWSYTHRGLAVMYIHPKHRSYMQPLVTSVNLYQDDLHRRFFYQGTDDVTKYYVVKDAIQYYTGAGGLEAIGSYNRQLVGEAAAMLADRWGTDLLQIPADMEAPNMRLVRLPSINRFPVVQEVPGDITTLFGDLYDLMFELMDRFHIIVLALYLQNKPYVRISANIYNNMDDYNKLAEAILTLKDEETS